MRLELIALPGIPLVAPGDDLAALIRDALVRARLALAAGDVLVVAQKIVSKTEGRFARLDLVTPSSEAERLARETEKDPRLVELILRESERVLRARPNVLIVVHKRGWVLANAGIDASNVGPGADGAEGTSIAVIRRSSPIARRPHADRGTVRLSKERRAAGPRQTLRRGAPPASARIVRRLDLTPPGHDEREEREREDRDGDGEDHGRASDRPIAHEPATWGWGFPAPDPIPSRPP